MIGSCTENLLSPSSYIEKHTLSGSEDVLRFAVGKNVILNVEAPKEDVPRVRDSARANSQILSEYKWEKKESGTTTGRILAVRDKLIAYRLSNGSAGEAVRVMERESRTRQLVKDFRHHIVDLQWAVHVPLLAVLDANANLYIYSVEENGQKLVKYLNIIQEQQDSDQQTAVSPGRLVWCPYIPEPDEADVEKEEVHLLGVIQGSKVNLFQLQKIKESIGRTEVSYERVEESGGLLSIHMDAQVSACKISPDATALAIATVDGNLSFYVIDDDNSGIQLASRLTPLATNFIEELIFLDNLCVNSQEQFWKYVALSSDNGRRLAIFDCDTWECLAKLRFECPNQVGRMEILVEPSTHFLFLVDYEASNLFCIELNSNSQQPGAPLCFASCTLITFCNHFISIVPCLLTEQTSEGGDLTLEDDEYLGGGISGHGGSTAIATLVAITHRSLSEINLELDRFLTADPSIALATISQTQTLQPARSRHQSHQHLEQQQQHSREPNSEPVLIGDFPPMDQPFISTAFDEISTKNNNAQQFFPSGGDGATAKKLTELMENNFDTFNGKLETLSLQLLRMQEENEHFRTNQNDNLSNVLEKISNELKLREDRIEAAVKKANKESVERILRSTEQQLTNYGAQMQRTLDLTQARMAEQLHGSVERAVVPQVEVLCTQLFQQLNDTFRNGIQEFMDQLRSVGQQQAAMMAAIQTQSAAAKEMQNNSIIAAGGGTKQQPPVDENVLNRFINGNQTRLAFELVINKGDQSLLNFVCNKVDPDDYFAVSASNSSVPLPIPLLLGLLRMLSAKLDLETDLRFRYVENVLLSLNNKQSLLTKEEFQKMVLDEKQFRQALDQLSKALKAFVDVEANAQWKRQTRIINQLVITLLRTA